MMAMRTWADAQKQGVSFYVTASGQLRIRRGSLTAAGLEELKTHRATIVAEWLWSLTAIPSPIAWDGAIGEALLRLAVDAIGPAAAPTEGRWPTIEAAQRAVDDAWKAEDLPGLVGSCQRWVVAVCDRGDSPVPDDQAS